jgi:leucyl/phenylalanyl-tRNA--protein transferase
MAENADDPALYWIEPGAARHHSARDLPRAAAAARTVRGRPFAVVCNRDFEAVLAAARAGAPAARGPGSTDGSALYRNLYDIGHCHPVEVYDDARLVGGLYGVSLGRTFFGESMFHRARDASKVALVHLVARLRAGGFRLLDTQFVTDHLKTFGATEVPRRRYHKLLADALVGEADFAVFPLGEPILGAKALARRRRRRVATRPRFGSATLPEVGPNTGRRDQPGSSHFGS